MPGIYSFSCGQAYAGHSNSLTKEEGATAPVEPAEYLSYLHTAKKPTIEAAGKDHLTSSISEMLATSNVADFFEIGVILLAFLTFAAVGFGAWGLLTWLKPKAAEAPVQQVAAPPTFYSSAPPYYPVMPQGAVLTSPSLGYSMTMTDPGYVAVSRLRTTVCR